MSENGGGAGAPDFDALVVGAGFAGLYMIHRLRGQGLRVRAIEAGSDVGGTWYWNRYPGARCDIPSIEYSYSFSPELEAEWRWTERYAAQPEILAYLRHVADRFDLRRDIRFDTRVTAAEWDEDGARWRVTLDDGGTMTARHLILATGALSTPKAPDLPGLDAFEGDVLHTGRWRDEVAIDGRRVAVFGTGSSGIQVIPELAKRAERVTVFQRTPNFAVPAGNRPLEDEEIAAVRPRLAELREEARRSFLGWFDPILEGSAKAFGGEERERRFEEQWRAGTTGLLRAFDDLLVDEESNAHAADFARRKIAELVNDPETARKMTPQGFPIGSRRLCSETGFFEAMNRGNVELVDVREEPVVEVTADAIVTERARYLVDAIVFATGFDALVGAVKAIDIRGRDGRPLAEEWEDGPRSYLGLAVSGFPNLFTVTGPGSPSVLSNVVVSIEQHVDWIARCIADLGARGADTIEAEEQAERDWMQHAHEVAQQTLFPRANSWYQGRTRDGRLVFMPYVGGVGPYREICDEIAAEGYRGFRIGGAGAAAPQARSGSMSEPGRRTVRAAVLREHGGPFCFEELELDPPRAHEVLVRIVASGVCHTDACVVQGELPTPLPVVLGHEGAGVVEAVGGDVVKVAPGDHVVLTFDSCGVCAGCQGGRPAACDRSFALNFAGARPDGSHALHGPSGAVSDRFFAQSSFATYAIAGERNIVKVPADVPLDLLGPLGCGIQTGAGSVLNGLDVEAGTSLVVFGTGAVGLSAIMAGAVAAATTIIAVDLVPERLALAEELGATHAIDGRDGDVLDQIRAITGGGTDYALDTTGEVGVIRTAVEALRPRGVCGIVGATRPGVELRLDTLDLMSSSKTLRGIVEGESVPDIFIPRLIALWRQGRFPFDRLVGHYDFADLDRAFEDSARGVTVKPVVRMPA